MPEVFTVAISTSHQTHQVLAWNSGCLVWLFMRSFFTNNSLRFSHKNYVYACIHHQIRCDIHTYCRQSTWKSINYRQLYVHRFYLYRTGCTWLCIVIRYVLFVVQISDISEVREGVGSDNMRKRLPKIQSHNDETVVSAHFISPLSMYQ